VFNIRNADKEDIPLIRELTFQVWPQTYSSLLSQDQIAYMLALMYSPESLERQMSEGCHFILISDEEKPVGFAAYQHMGNDIWKLHKLYVLPSQQGKGGGRYVMDHILKEIKKKGALALQLQVKRDNPARSFYENLGYRIIYEADFDIGNGYFMKDFVMEKRLDDQ
jgi:diamine N-acetyltransferase